MPVAVGMNLIGKLDLQAFDEVFVVVRECQPAKHDDDAETDPEHGVDLAVFEPDPSNLGKGGDDGNRRGDVDITELESGKKQNDRE